MAGLRAGALPAAYAKFLTALAGEAIAYIQLDGTTWHLNAALVMAGAALAVLGVPNGSAPAAVKPAQPEPPSNVSVTPPPPARLTP